MAKDRALDRHKTSSYPYRPEPADLLQRLDEVAGPRRRSEVISELLARLLDGRPMPPRSWLKGKADKPGQRHGA